jgi:hypothetical protein
MSAAQTAIAEPTQSTPPASYRDLLEPVPDALNALKADDARLAAEKTQGGEQLAPNGHADYRRFYQEVAAQPAPRGALAAAVLRRTGNSRPRSRLVTAMRRASSRVNLRTPFQRSIDRLRFTAG